MVLTDNRNRGLDMDDIIAGVENQYANMAIRTRAEAEKWNQKKVRRRKILSLKLPRKKCPKCAVSP